jgi:hypothetical protein
VTSDHSPSLAPADACRCTQCSGETGPVSLRGVEHARLSPGQHATNARFSLNTCVCIRQKQAIAQACSPDDVVLAIRDLATPDQETPSFALWIISGELAKNHVGYLPHMGPGMPRPSCDAACAGRVYELPALARGAASGRWAYLGGSYECCSLGMHA